MFPLQVFDSSTKRKILRVLAEKNKRYTLSELAEMCNRSKATISRALKNIDRYSFLEKTKIQGSKELLIHLKPGDRYTTAIRDFFKTEKALERQDGMIPVDIWNILEECTKELSNKIKSIHEIFLFGSYATGEYHSGSDIDLLITTFKNNKQEKTINEILQKIQDKADRKIQYFEIKLPIKIKNKTDKKILDEIKRRSPADKKETLIPLIGNMNV